MLDLNSETFRDKVYGCWLGKNCGGTLGAPLEKAFGEPEPFDVWWYPELKEGGIPNDDLEMQLIWLKALEEVGPALQAKDLAQYWLDHIGYNWDEYGLSKTNLLLGLLPPVSGNYNNWFKDSMGCPIRSEIWACIAPGLPNLAVRYAYEDAICDHAGGESVFGELFNTAIESAAFVLADREKLLDIGLSYVPPWSQTAKAIIAARESYAEGEDWQTARKRVLQATPHYNAQYSPINMGFQVIGWLYGEDFGDAICKAVNCGYDTDCTGATLGSYLGILAGGKGLPHKWTEPLGEDIATNESWGGLYHASDGSNPVPATLEVLTQRVITQAKRVLTAKGILNGDAIVRVEPSELYADESTQALWVANSTRLDYSYGTLNVGVDYLDTPAVFPGEQKALHVHLTNPHPETLRTRCEILSPDGWTSTPAQFVDIPAHTSVETKWNIAIPHPAYVENANTLLLSVKAEARPAQHATPLMLIGASCYLHSDVYAGKGHTDSDLFEHDFGPEQVAHEEAMFTQQGRQGDWTAFYARENALPLQDIFQESGVLYVRTYLWNPGAEKEVWMGAASSCPTKMWVNNQQAVAFLHYPLVRPSYAGNKESYANVQLHTGWNEVLLKFVRSDDAPPFECYFVFSGANELHEGLPLLGRTRTPWDA